MSSPFDPSDGRAIPEDEVPEEGLALDEDPAALGITFDVVPASAASADPTRSDVGPAYSPVAFQDDTDGVRG